MYCTLYSISNILYKMGGRKVLTSNSQRSSASMHLPILLLMVGTVSSICTVELDQQQSTVISQHAPPNTAAHGRHYRQHMYCRAGLAMVNPRQPACISQYCYSWQALGILYCTVGCIKFLRMKDEYGIYPRHISTLQK